MNERSIAGVRVDSICGIWHVRAPLGLHDTHLALRTTSLYTLCSELRRDLLTHCSFHYMNSIRSNEWDLPATVHADIATLRNACFPNDQHDRSYGKQLPHFRYLVYDDDQLVGHMGVDHRVISVGGIVLRIFGGIDVCVAATHRRKGITHQLLTTLATYAQACAVDFLFLVADDDRVYTQNGFVRVSQYCSWLRIDEHTNYGVAFQKLTNEFMVKPTSTKTWPDGPIDLLGYMF